MEDPRLPNIHEFSKYDSAIKALEQLNELCTKLQTQKDNLEVENLSKENFIQFQKEKSERLNKQAEDTKKALEHNLSQLNSVYLNVLGYQQKMVVSNMKLTQNIEALTSLYGELNKNMSNRIDEIHFEGYTPAMMESTINNIKDFLRQQSKHEKDFLNRYISSSSDANKNFIESIIDLVQKQSNNFYKKLDAVIRMTESYILKFSKQYIEVEMPLLAKRENFISLHSNVDPEAEKFKNQKLLSENKFLLFVVDYYQKKILQHNISIPVNHLNTEYLAKNKGYLVDPSNSTFAQIGELYDKNVALELELRKYKSSSYLSQAYLNDNQNAPSLEQLKKEFDIIIDQAKTDQQSECLLLIQKLADQLGAQNKQIEDLHKALSNFETQNNALSYEKRLLEENLEIAQKEKENLKASVKELSNNQNYISQCIQERLKSTDSKSPPNVEIINEFMEVIMQNSSLLISTVTHEWNNCKIEIQNTPTMIDQIFDRLNQENKNLRSQVDILLETNASYVHEKNVLLEKIEDLEKELKTANAQEEIEQYLGQIEQITKDINELNAKHHDSVLKYEERIQILEGDYQINLDQLTQMKESMKESFDKEMVRALTNFQQLKERSTKELEAHKIASYDLLISKDNTILTLQKSLDDIQNNSAQEKSELHQQYNKEIQLLKDQIFILDEKLRQISHEAKTEIEGKVKHLLEEIEMIKKAHSEQMSRQESEYEGLMRDSAIRIKDLEHMLGLTQFTRDNFTELLDYSYDNGQILRTLIHPDSNSSNAEQIPKTY